MGDPKRLTGAGDVWDAASIHFFLNGEVDADRLALANAQRNTTCRPRSLSLRLDEKYSA